jgi:hypothetical protein
MARQHCLSRVPPGKRIKAAPISEGGTQPRGIPMYIGVGAIVVIVIIVLVIVMLRR